MVATGPGGTGVASGDTGVASGATNLASGATNLSGGSGHLNDGPGHLSGGPGDAATHPGAGPGTGAGAAGWGWRRPRSRQKHRRTAPRANGIEVREWVDRGAGGWAVARVPDRGEPVVPEPPNTRERRRDATTQASSAGRIEMS